MYLKVFSESISGNVLVGRGPSFYEIHGYLPVHFLGAASYLLCSSVFGIKSVPNWGYFFILSSIM